MRLKIILIGIAVIVVGLFFASSRVAFAQQWCGGCTVYTVPYTITDEEGFPIVVNVLIDGCDGCTTTSCGSGFYE